LPYRGKNLNSQQNPTKEFSFSTQVGKRGAIADDLDLDLDVVKVMSRSNLQVLTVARY